MKRINYLILFISFFYSCGSMDKNDRIVRRNDFINRFSKKDLIATASWKMGEDKLLLRRNKTFRIYSKIFGFVNSGYYSGKYEISNDTLKLKYIKNHKLSYDELYFSKEDSCEVLICNEKTFFIEHKLIK